MPRLKSPIGQAFAAGLTSTPGRSSGLGTGYITFTVEPAAVSALTDRLESIDKQLRKQIVKKALRKWGAEVRKAARQFAWRNAERTKRQLTVKVKAYKKAIWAGVGVKTAKTKTNPSEQRAGRNSPLVGWKAHFMEVGWRAWPRGKSGNKERIGEALRNDRIKVEGGAVRQITVYRKGKPHVRTIRERTRKLAMTSSAGGGGRGWRRGIRNRFGALQTQYARHYMFKAHVVGKRIAPALIIESINAAIDDVARGKIA